MYSWFDEFDKMRREMDTIFNHMYPQLEHGKLDYGSKTGNKALTTYNSRSPAVNQYEEKNKLITEIELPGVDKKDVKLFIDEDHIEVKVEQKAESETKEKGYYRYESKSASFYRQIPFPVAVDFQKAVAEQKDGVLRIEAPKLKLEENKRKQLEIR